MPDIRTKEGREVLRDGLVSTGALYYQDAKAALDGLDIAQEMAGWIRTTHAAFSLGENEALAKWDKWQKGDPG